MALSESLCGKHHGGVVRITLYDAGKILSATFDTPSGYYTAIEVEEGYTPIEVALAEGESRWSESVGGDGGVEHRVEVALRGTRGGALVALQALSEVGVVALVEGADGGRYLVGYSPRAAADYPLRLAEGSLHTYAHRSEMPTTKAILISTDGWFSFPLLGE